MRSDMFKSCKSLWSNFSLCLVLITLTLLTFSGCSMVSKAMVSNYVDTSKYNPLIVSESDEKAYQRLLESVQGQVVEDKLGTYYHDFYSGRDFLGIFQISRQYGEFMKVLLRDETGLMEPIYHIGMSKGLLIPEPDWELTQTLHAKLSQVMTLLPMSETRAYHEHLMRAIKKLYQQRVGNNVQFTPYNADYYKVVKPFASKGTKYVISFSRATIERCFSYNFNVVVQEDVFRRLRAAGDSSARVSDPHALWLENTIDIYRLGVAAEFLSVDIFKEMQFTGWDPKAYIPASSRISDEVFSKAFFKKQREMSSGLIPGLKKEQVKTLPALYERKKAAVSRINEELKKNRSQILKMHLFNIGHIKRAREELKLATGLSTETLE